MKNTVYISFLPLFSWSFISLLTDKTKQLFWREEKEGGRKNEKTGVDDCSLPHQCHSLSLNIFKHMVSKCQNDILLTYPFIEELT